MERNIAKIQLPFSYSRSRLWRGNTKHAKQFRLYKTRKTVPPFGGRAKQSKGAKQFRLWRERKTIKKGKTVPPLAGEQKNQKEQNSSAFGGSAKQSKKAKQFRLWRERKTIKKGKKLKSRLRRFAEGFCLFCYFACFALRLSLFCLFCSPSFAILLVLLSVFFFTVLQGLPSRMRGSVPVHPRRREPRGFRSSSSRRRPREGS